jgi:hypothetical protein
MWLDEFTRIPQAGTEVGMVVAVVAAEPGGSAGVGLVSGAQLASAGFAWLGDAPSVHCCCWPVYCWPNHCSGCSSYSPSKKCLEKRCINILESNRTLKLYAVIFIYLYLSDEVVDKGPKQSHDSHQALTSMQQNIHTTRLMTLDITWVAPSECRNRRVSDCSLQAPCLKLG